jgi:hypothetical protein
MSCSKLERTMQVITAIVGNNKRFILSFARSQPDVRKDVEFRLPTGAQVRLTFTDFDSLLAVAAGHENVSDRAEWMTMRLRIDGETKVEGRFRSGEVELDTYTPGSWERAFGLANDNDRSVLLPAALRGRTETV